MSEKNLQVQEAYISKEYICSEIASGRSIKSIEEEFEFKRGTIYRAGSLDSSFQESVLQARAAAVHSMVDELQDLALNTPDVQRARLLTDNIKWAASKLMPSVYGDRLDLNVNHSVDISQAIEQGRKQIEGKRQALIDATPRLIEAEIIEDLNEGDKMEFG